MIRRVPPHVWQRARERYGVVLRPRAIARMCAAIALRRDDRARYLVTQPHGREVWLVLHGRVDTTWMLAVWEPVDRTIVTFLPLGAQFTDDGVRIHEPPAREAVAS